MEMNFCRRCGTQLAHVESHVYKCDKGHTIFNNESPAVGVLFTNDNKEVLMAIRAIDPGKGRFDMPGGFCDGAETFEDAVIRELQEELNITPQDYDNVEFLFSFIDPYDYGGERQSVLAGVFTARLKPGTTLKPEDDVAEVKFMKYEDIDQSKIQFPSQVAGLKLLHERGII
jgi:NAD+ diphosphatase